MINFFNSDKFRRRSNSLVQERVPQKAGGELRIPSCKDLYLLVAAPEINSSNLDVTGHKSRLIKRVEQSEFLKHASALSSSTEWFRLLPAEWILSEFAPLLERLSVQESVKRMIQRASKLVKIQVTEGFDLQLEQFQLLNFITAEFARNVKGVVFEPCSFKLYDYNNRTLKSFEHIADGVPSLSSFLTVLKSRQADSFHLTTHGLARFDLPEFELDRVALSMGDSCAFLMNAMSQSLVEQVVSTRTDGALSLREPFVVSTDHVITGNRGNLPFQACIPRRAEIPLKLSGQDDGSSRLILDVRDEERDAVLCQILERLSLLVHAAQ